MKRIPTESHSRCYLSFIKRKFSSYKVYVVYSYTIAKQQNKKESYNMHMLYFRVLCKMPSKNRANFIHINHTFSYTYLGLDALVCAKNTA